MVKPTIFGGDGDGDNKLSFTFKDTGLSDSDGITNNNTITVDGLNVNFSYT
jgi:hypothetical protein